MIYKNGAVQGFNGGNYFLSNFFQHRLEYKGLFYPSSENAYQASKCIDSEDRESFTMLSPRDAKYLGGKVKMREDWDYMKYEIMTNILIEKFRDERLQKLLGDTYPKYLVEGNTWHDNIWGDCKCRKRKSCKETGKNWLGLILMDIRKDIIEV